MMSGEKSTAVELITYAQAVRSFIRELLRRFLGRKVANYAIPDDDTDFEARIAAALAEVDGPAATERDCRAKVVSVLCDEVAAVCKVTRDVLVSHGYDKYAESYLSDKRLVRLLLRHDREKIGRLNALVAEAGKPLIVLLREIGEVLGDRASDGAAFPAAELKKGSSELKAIAEDVKSGLDEVRREIAAVGEKVSKQNCRGNRRGKYDEGTVAFCMAAMAAAESNDAIKSAVNTRVTHGAVYEYNRSELERRGVKDVRSFKLIVRAAQACVRRARIKELEERRKSAAKANTERGKNGIIHAVTGRNAGGAIGGATRTAAAPGRRDRPVVANLVS